MSHFSVFVIAEDEEQLAERLLPYYEYGTSSELDELVKPYLKWVNAEDEYRKRWKTETAPAVLIEDEDTKEYVFAWKNPHAERVPMNVIFPEFETFLSEFGNFKYREGHGWGYWHNPNAKWDWYAIGGRWSYELLLTNGDRADTALMGEVSWEEMAAENAERAGEEWDRWRVELGKMGYLPITWAALTKEERDKVLVANREIENLVLVYFFEPQGTTRAEHVKARSNTSKPALRFPCSLSLTPKENGINKLKWAGGALPPIPMTLSMRN